MSAHDRKTHPFGSKLKGKDNRGMGIAKLLLVHRLAAFR